jgi:glycosyltransferase involved in cell wall biosynthesis
MIDEPRSLVFMDVSTSRRTNLLCLIGQLGNGGTERQLYLFLKHLDRARIQPLVVVSDEPRGSWRERIEGELGVPVVFLGGVPAPLKLWRFWRLIRQVRPQVVFSWSFFTNGFRLATGRTPFVGSLRQQLDAERRQLSAGRVRISLECPRLVVNSAKLADDLREAEVNENRILLIHNIYEPMSRPLPDRAALRRELGLPPDAVVVAGVGRDSPTKNWPFFLDTFAAAKEKCPSLHALLIGSGGPALLPAIREKGLAEAFTVTGEVPEARRLLPAADIFFLSSRAEGLPNVLLEAADAGCAILATDVGGVRDILEKSEIRNPKSQVDVDIPAGKIVNSDDSTEAVTGMIRLATSPQERQAMADQAHAALQRFTPGAIMKQYLQALGMGGSLH